MILVVIGGVSTFDGAGGALSIVTAYLTETYSFVFRTVSGLAS